MNKPRTVKPSPQPVTEQVLRMVAMRPETADEKTKSVEVVIASENPVERYDKNTQSVYHEILMMDGVRFRAERFRLPIVDSHDRSTVRNVLGSVRDIKVEGSELVGVASFARDRDSQDAFDKLLDGHLTDFSITATPNESQVIRRDESTTIRGETINGPAEIITDWTPTDASLVAAGADETSTVRALLRAYEIPNGSDDVMNEEQRAAMIEKGMPETIENAAEALDWMIQNMDESSEEVAEGEAVEIEIEKAEGKAENEIEKEDTEEVTERATKAERQRTREIKSLCKKAKVERAFADKLIDDGTNLDQAREQLLERMMTKPIGATAGGERIEVVSDGNERFAAAARDGLIARAMQGVSRSDPFGKNKPADGYEDFQGISLRRLSEEILRRGGLPVNRMTSKDVAMVAMGNRATINRLRHNGIMRDESYHTTGLLPNLMLDAANKTLLAGYDEAPFTWDIWARQGQSVADFKNINRIRYSESPDLLMVPEGKEYKEGKTSDAKESYAVEKFGRMFSITWETVVNDDLDAISRVPQMHGNAARRTQNKKVYEVLTANAAMADRTALFASGHSNLAGSGAAPSVSTLNAMFTAMRTQTGLEGEIIGVMPRFLIVPAALEATALELFTSTGRPDVGGDTTGNSGVQNIYGPGGRRSIEVVSEPQLDGNSSTAWYVAADNASIDTVELTFLAGEESPVLESEWDFDKDCYKYKVRQTFGTKAIDWRGLYKNPGA